MELTPMDKMVIPSLFSTKEKQSLYQDMCAVRLVGNHNMREKENHIREVMTIVEITSSDQIQSRLLTKLQINNILKRIDNINKLYFAKFVSITGLVGGLSEKEEMFINSIYSEICVSGF